MKKLTYILLAFTVFFSACQKEEVVDDTTTDNSGDPNTPTKSLTVSPSEVSIQVGEETQFTATLAEGESTSDVTWISLDPAIAEVVATGTIKGVAEGTTYIKANTVEGIVDSAFVQVSKESQQSISRSGQFTGTPSYDVSGTVLFTRTADGKILLEFQSDFLSDSGPGLYLYLTTTEDASKILTEGLEIGTLSQQSGAFTIDVSALFPNLQLSDYDYLYIHCKPFDVPFGHATFESL
jgi:hypothetical protein